MFEISRTKSFFWPWNFIFLRICRKEEEKDKIADELHKGTSNNKKKSFAARKILRLSNAKECEQRRFFVWFPQTSFFFLFLLFHLDGLRFFRVCRMDGGRKKGMKRYRRQIIISDCQCYMGEWMINKSKYHVEKRFSVRSFPRRFSSMHRDIHCESIYWIFMRSQCDLLKYYEIRHQFVLWQNFYMYVIDDQKYFHDKILIFRIMQNIPHPQKKEVIISGKLWMSIRNSLMQIFLIFIPSSMFSLSFCLFHSPHYRNLKTVWT